MAKKASNRSRGKALGPHVSLIHIRIKTNACGQFTSGVGALSNASSVTSKTLDPYECGGRFGSLAAFWQQYRIKSGRIDYEPFGSPAGFVSDVTGGTASATAVVAERDFAWIWLPDQDVSLTTSDQILDSGGKVQNTTRKSSCVIYPTPWLWVSTDVPTATPPSGTDYRQVSFGRLSACFTATSTTAARLYGQFSLDLWVEFRHEHTTVSVIGGPSRLGDEKSLAGDLEDDTSDAPVVVETTPVNGVDSSLNAALLKFNNSQAKVHEAYFKYLKLLTPQERLARQISDERDLVVSTKV